MYNSVAFRHSRKRKRIIKYIYTNGINDHKSLITDTSNLKAYVPKTNVRQTTTGPRGMK